MKNIGWFAVMMAAACGGGPKPATIGNSGGGGDAVTLEWKATQAAGENVNVTLVVAGKPVAIGSLNAASDDAPGTPQTCSIAKSDATMSQFTCGATPAYNFYVAKREGSELIVSLVTGVDGGEGNDPKEEQKEVKRIPVGGGALTTSPYEAGINAKRD